MEPVVPVYVEQGAKRTVASALDWPGWCRIARDERSALEALLAYGPRYASAVARARKGFRAPADLSRLRVVERLRGDATTDFGVPAIEPKADRTMPDDKDLSRLVALLKACWATFDDTAEQYARVALRTGPRGGGRTVDGIVAHVFEAERAYLSKLGARFRGSDDPARESAALRAAFVGALTARVRGEPVPDPSATRKLRSPRYAVRRSAWHALDHAWEIEDRGSD